MTAILKNGVYTFSLFAPYPELIHGFSTKQIGDMRPSHNHVQKSIQRFSEVLACNPAMIVRMNQVHSSSVEWVGLSEAGKVLPKTDGLLTETRNLFLGVVTADCVPIMLYDRYTKIVGVVHAGWRGVYSEIIKNTIENMIEKGSNRADILTGIGPCVRSCCYTIDKSREELFRTKFAKDNVPLPYLIDYGEKLYLNLPLCAAQQLMEGGVLSENIQDSGICTVDMNEHFYSSRKEGEAFGEFMGIIGRV